MKTVIVNLTLEVPDNATDKDIQDYIDVEFCWWGGMQLDNTCRELSNVVEMEWKHES